MTSSNNNYTPPSEEILIHRVIEGDSSREDWLALEQLADGDRCVWERLARTLQVEAELRRDGKHAVSLADHIELTSEISAPRNFLPRWAGWAAAVVLAAAWVVGSFSSDSGDPRNEGSLPASETQTADSAYMQYIQKGISEGRILEELPRVVMETRPAAKGDGVEVLYVRRLLERTVVDQFFQAGSDDQGKLTPKPVPMTRFVDYGSF